MTANEIKKYFHRRISTKTLGEIEVDDIMTNANSLSKNRVHVYCSDFAEDIVLTVEEFLKEIE